MSFFANMPPFTLFHTIISLVGIATGFPVVFAMLGGRRLTGWTAIFLVTTVLTSVTGYFFPFFFVTPAHIVGAISLVLLALAVVALQAKHLQGHWRWIYVVGVVFSQHLNVFVLVVQLFRRVPALRELAPNQTEPPFGIAQGIILLVFIALAVLAVRKFHPGEHVPGVPARDAKAA